MVSRRTPESCLGPHGMSSIKFQLLAQGCPLAVLGSLPQRSEGRADAPKRWPRWSLHLAEFVRLTRVTLFKSRPCLAEDGESEAPGCLAPTYLGSKTVVSPLNDRCPGSNRPAVAPPASSGHSSSSVASSVPPAFRWTLARGSGRGLRGASPRGLVPVFPVEGAQRCHQEFGKATDTLPQKVRRHTDHLGGQCHRATRGTRGTAGQRELRCVP